MTAPFAAFDALKVPLDGRNVINASAGTGKTYAITTLVVRLLVERQLDIRQILVVTFTEAASAELRARVRARVREALLAFRLVEQEGPQTEMGLWEGDNDFLSYARERKGRTTIRADRHRLELALQNIDEAPISTIHGFCHRILHDAAFESGVAFESEMVTDLQALRDEVICDYWANVMTSSPTELARRLDRPSTKPSNCQRLVDKIMRDPAIRVLPDTNDGTDIRLTCWNKMRASWDRKAVAAELNAKDTFVNSHTAGVVNRWLDEVDLFLKQPEPLFDAPPMGVRTLNAGNRKDRFKRIPGHPFFLACESFLAACDDFAGDRRPEVVDYKKGLIEYAREEIPKRKNAAGVLSFDDLLLILRDALRGDGGSRLAPVIRDQYRAALIDEFQDTDPVQFAIFSAIYSGQDLPLFLIGDPKQAIYAFRGADVFAYLQAVLSETGARYTMQVNWRSDRDLVPAVNQIFKQREGMQRPFVLDGIDYPLVRPRKKGNAFRARGNFLSAPLEFLFADTGGDTMSKGEAKQLLPRAIASEISALLRSGSQLEDESGIRNVAPRDIAVLCRSNAQCFQVQSCLRELQVAAVVLGDESVFASHQAAELQRVLAAVVEVTSPKNLRNALATDLLGVTGNQLTEMEDDPTQWDRWAGLLRGWNALWTEKGFVQMFRAFLVEGGVRERLLQLTDGERRMTNLLHLGELLHGAARESHLGPAGLLHWLAMRRAEKALTAERAEIRLESDDAAVKLTTIHKSKGLEYPIVFCPFLWDGWLLHKDDRSDLRFHDTDGTMALDIGSSDFSEHEKQAEVEALAENLRVLYVALTRAKNKCLVVWGDFKDADTSALGYLLHPPETPPGRGVTVDDLRNRASTFNEATMRAQLLQRQQDGDDGAGIGVRTWDLASVAEAGVIVPRPAGDAQALTARRIEQRIRSWWRTSSFSSLIAKRVSLEVDVAEGREREDAVPLEAGGVIAGNDTAVEPTLLASFPRGAKAGNFFHAVLENIDFTESAATSAIADRVIEDQLLKHGFSPSEWKPLVTRAMDEIAASPILPGNPALKLSSLSSKQRRNEMEFFVPIANSNLDQSGNATPLTQKGLADLFRMYPSKEVPASYAEQLGQLRFLPLHGYLKGYIDLVFQYQDRFYVVDYKSNHLGDTPADYAPSYLTGAMDHGHYFLQYHLYTLAVHRHLGRTLKNYDYERDFGGVLYLFLRGMTAGGNARSSGGNATPGVFFEKPPHQRILALSALLHGQDPGGLS